MGMVGFTVALVVITVIVSPCVYGKQLSDQQEIKVQRLLKRLNKPAHKSIKVFKQQYYFLQLHKKKYYFLLCGK